MSFDLRIVEGDFVFENGSLVQVQGEDKLVQDILKIALTEVGANPVQPWYGSLVSRSLIGTAMKTDIVLTYAKSQLQSALENLKKLQNLQVSSGQKMSPSEQLSYISDISVIRDPADPRVYKVSISVLNRAYGKVSATFGVSNT